MKFLSKIFGGASSAEAAAIRFHPTETCRECGSQLAQRDGETDWCCPNQDCPARLRERLAHWCSPGAMDIPQIDAALVAALVSKGLAYDPAELYRVKLKELAALEGMDAARAQKIYDGITASQKREAWRMIYGLSIPRVDAAIAQALGRFFPNVDAVFATGAGHLSRVAGIPDIVAQSLVRWYADSINRKLVKQLEKAGVNFDFRK